MYANIKLLGLGAVSALLFAQDAVAKTIAIQVGEGGLKYAPNSTTAAVGDILEFQFVASTHNVVQGAFNTPCSVGNITNGFAAPFVNVTAVGTHEAYQVTVNNTDPIWYYCSVTGHCQDGMVGVVNPPDASTGKTLAAYAAGAKASNKSVTASAVGGKLVNVTSTNATATSSSGSSATSSQAATVTNLAVGNAMNWGLLATMGFLAGGAAVFLQ